MNSGKYLFWKIHTSKENTLIDPLNRLAVLAPMHAWTLLLARTALISACRLQKQPSFWTVFSAESQSWRRQGDCPHRGYAFSCWETATSPLLWSGFYWHHLLALTPDALQSINSEHIRKTVKKNRQKTVTGFTFSRPDLQWMVDLHCQGKVHWDPEWDLVLLANWINSGSDSTWLALGLHRESTLKKPFVFSESHGPQLQISALPHLLMNKEHSPKQMNLPLIQGALC